MATAEQIETLVRSDADGDDTRSYASALQEAALRADSRFARGDET